MPIGATEELCANHDMCGGHGLRLENGLCVPCVDGVGARLERSDAGEECPVCLSAVATVKQPQCAPALPRVRQALSVRGAAAALPVLPRRPPGLAAEIALREQIGEDAFAQLYAERPPVDDDDDDDDDDDFDDDDDDDLVIDAATGIRVGDLVVGAAFRSSPSRESAPARCRAIIVT